VREWSLFPPGPWQDGFLVYVMLPERKEVGGAIFFGFSVGWTGGFFLSFLYTFFFSFWWYPTCVNLHSDK
jgi:hypothetical protein